MPPPLRHFQSSAKSFFIPLVVLLLTRTAGAEYRAYELAITDTVSGKTRVVISTLDHVQYPDYYRLAPNEVIRIQSTWMCWRRSDYFRSICANPNSLAQATPIAPATGVTPDNSSGAAPGAPSEPGLPANSPVSPPPPL